MKTKIYTKGGDTGETSIIGGARVSKSTPQLDAYGDVDELNTTLGISLAHLKNDIHSSQELTSVEKTLMFIQNELFAVGSQLACEDREMRTKMPQLKDSALYELEVAIDQMTDELPELKEFILPGGCVTAAHLHLARTVCRRAERSMVEWINASDAQNGLSKSGIRNDLKESNAKSDLKTLIRFINRLSDYLFVAARYVNFKVGSTETKWKK